MNVVKLEEHFQRLRLSLSSAPSARLNLSRLEWFFAQLHSQPDPQVVQTYYLELIGPFMEVVAPETLAYRPVSFLENLFRELPRFKLTCPSQARSETFRRVEELIVRALAQTHFYLGAWQAGVGYLKAPEEQGSLATLFTDKPEKNALPLIERFHQLVERVKPRDGELGELLAGMAQEWSSLVAEPQRERVWCVLIEQEETSHFMETAPVGTIRSLALQGSLRPRDVDQDYFLFNNRSLSLNDLLHQQVQDAATCARRVLSLSRTQKQQHYKFLYSFPVKDSFYTGDSLGLGLGLLNLAFLSEITGQPHHFYLSQRMVVTGALDMLGEVRPIGDQSLRVKLEAVFYSPFSEVVLPRKNSPEAEKYLRTLTRDHGGKRVTIHAVKTLGECLQNKTLVTKRKVFLPKRVVATRRRRIWGSVILGITVLAFLASWLFTRRDTVPVKLIPQGQYVLALNTSGKELWRYDVGVELLEKYSLDLHSPYKRYLIDDLNGDGQVEVVFATGDGNNKSIDGSVYYLTHSGKLLWRFHDHPVMTFGTEVMDDYYITQLLTSYDFEGDGQQEIVAVFTNKPWYPCRIAILNLKGEVLEEYWHSGYIRCLTVIDIDRDGVGEILFGGANNDYDQAVVGVLEYGYLSGHSPEDDKNYVPQGVPRGTERYYFRFPHWNKLIPLPDNARMDTHLIQDLGHEQMRVNIYSGLFGGAPDMMFRLGYDLRVVEFDFIDGFNRSYFAKYGHDLSVDYSPEFLREYFSRLEFWDGDRWVTEPRENKYWREGK